MSSEKRHTLSSLTSIAPSSMPTAAQECAFEDRDAQPFYEEYHNTVRNFVDEIRADNGGLGLLFDIHGTTQIDHDPADVYLGTLNGQAISSLLSRDSLAMSRKRSLPGLLREAGYVVSAKIPETLRGDFTLETYGSSNADGVDAIQIEIESTLRTDASKREVFIEDLAYAISSLVARYADTPDARRFSERKLPAEAEARVKQSCSGV